jgi:hypothetical protein
MTQQHALGIAAEQQQGGASKGNMYLLPFKVLPPVAYSPMWLALG